MPMVVRSFADKIYVWSAMTLQFLVYGNNGEYLESYSYVSAVNDFIPCEDKIYISPAGARDEYVVDVFDIDTKSVSASLTLATEEQKTMRMWSVSPITVSSGTLYYMPKDRLAVYRCALEDLSRKDSLKFESETFSVPKVEDSVSSVRDKGKYVEFQDKASFAMGIFIGKNDNEIKVLTSEGEYSENAAERTDNRYYTVYDIVGGKLKKSYSFHDEAFADCSLVSNVNGEMYFLRNEIQEGASEEKWTLCKAEL